MEDIRRILVGVDLGPRRGRLTPGSRLAVDHVRWLALRLGASVALHHSTAGGEAFCEEEQDYVVVPDGIVADEKDTLERVAGELRDAGIEVELALSEERAWVSIVERVARDRIDLVVTGKRSAASHADQRIGGVSRNLLRSCPCPVWLLKPGSSPPPPRRVLAATDLSPVGERVVRLAAGLAAEADAELHVVHALQLPFAVQFEGADAEREWERQRRAEAQWTIETQVRASSYAREPIYHVGITAPTRAVLGCAERHPPDVVVMATLSRSGIAGVVMGNTAERLLDRLECSLLAVKPAGFRAPVDP